MNNAPESDEKLLIKNDSKYYIMSCDIGTSSLRCIIYNEKAIKICATHEKIKLLCPQPGFVEIDPVQLWEKFVHSVREALEVSNLAASKITCLGLSTQRASFMLWDKISGEPFHNFITWKDVRADTMINDWNSSLLMKAVRLGTGFLYHIMRKKRYLAASILKFQNTHVNMRLKWILENNTKVKEAIDKKTLMFGTIDTWLVYQLTNGKVYATDPSNASGTGIYDPYLKEWSGFLIKLINLPKDIFPKVKNTYGKLADISPQHFGASIPITAVISDQGAAMFGGCGFDQGDVKITLGTGAFFDLNTGHEPHTSINGIYPVIGWEDDTGIIYMSEGSSNDNGTVIQWGKDMKLYDDYAETSALAESVSDTGGVYFIPSFQGLQAPINDAQAACGFIGLSLETRREHLVRAMLESLAFRVYQIYRTLRKETNYKFLTVRVDGGVAQNDFLLQMISTMIDKKLERFDDIEASSLGACFLAGLGAGIWNNKNELKDLCRAKKIFYPEPEKRDELFAQMKNWERGLHRFTNWYPKGSTKTKSLSWKNYLLSVTSEWSEKSPDDAMSTPTASKCHFKEYIPRGENHRNFTFILAKNIFSFYVLALIIIGLMSYVYFSQITDMK